MHITTEIAILIKKHLDGVLTSNEHLRLQAWAEDNDTHKEFLKKVLQGGV